MPGTGEKDVRRDRLTEINRIASEGKADPRAEEETLSQTQRQDANRADERQNCQVK